MQMIRSFPSYKKMSVDINGKEGITVVGSMQSSAFGVYQKDPSVYPYKNSTSIKFPLPSNLEQYGKAGVTYSPTRGNLRLVDYVLKTQIDSESIHTNPMNQKARVVTEKGMYDVVAYRIKYTYHPAKFCNQKYRKFVYLPSVSYLR